MTNELTGWLTSSKQVEWLTDWLTNQPYSSMEQSHPWGSSSFSTSQKLFRISCKRLPHSCVQKRRLLVRILSELNPVQTLSFLLSKIYFYCRLIFKVRLSFRFSCRNLLFISLLPYTRHLKRLFYPHLFHHPKYTLQSVIHEACPYALFSSLMLPSALRHKYLSHLSVLGNSHSVLFAKCEGPNFAANITTDKIVFLRVV